MIAAVVVALTVITIVATESIDDQRAEAPPPTASTTTADDVISTTTTSSTTTTTTTTTTTLPPEVVAIDTMLVELGDRGVAQQLVVFGAAGADPATSIADALGDTCVGGVFVTKNVGNWAPAESLDAAATAIAMIDDAASGCAAPPFITTDAEAGTRVLKVPVDPLPSPATLEANHRLDPATTSEGLAPAAEAFATALADAGVHVNLGIIADVDAGAGFYMDRQGRSFGDDPAIVTDIAGTIVAGHCRAGVVPTLKHFPNQGSTVEDPHDENSFSVNDFDAWLEFGAAPYADSLAPMVMTGHIRYAGVDEGLPATLSREITTGWLRDELGYDGIVITDDLHSMRGVDEFASAERGVTAIAAGADLALYVATEDGAAVVAAIEARMATDEMFATQARNSARRVLELKGRLGLLPDVDPAWFADIGCLSPTR